MSHESQRLREGFVSFLSPYEWTHVITATSRFEVSVTALFGEFRRGFIRRLARMAQTRVPYFVAAESTHSGRYHLHAVVGGISGLCLDQIQGAWGSGFSRIEAYDPDRGALPYLVKGISEHIDDFDLSARFPLLRSVEPASSERGEGEQGDLENGPRRGTS